MKAYLTRGQYSEIEREEVEKVEFLRCAGR